MESARASRGPRAVGDFRDDRAAFRLTAHAMTGYRQQCLDAEMDDYLVKPYVGAAFDAMLGRWLD